MRGSRILIILWGVWWVGMWRSLRMRVISILAKQPRVVIRRYASQISLVDTHMIKLHNFQPEFHWFNAILRITKLDTKVLSMRPDFIHRASKHFPSLFGRVYKPGVKVPVSPDDNSFSCFFSSSLAVSNRSAAASESTRFILICQPVENTIQFPLGPLCRRLLAFTLARDFSEFRVCVSSICLDDTRKPWDLSLINSSLFFFRPWLLLESLLRDRR